MYPKADGEHSRRERCVYERLIKRKYEDLAVLKLERIC